ncbi:hypothetical protein CRENBAI_018219 [Crenichthys baileyi]|uniref:Uncharacterized protein n=1 Tax=Crenichthys baileyi TaxID=28760 RepID=A0AAV9SHF5_9TELE
MHRRHIAHQHYPAAHASSDHKALVCSFATLSEHYLSARRSSTSAGSPLSTRLPPSAAMRSSPYDSSQPPQTSSAPPTPKSQAELTHTHSDPKSIYPKS